MHGVPHQFVWLIHFFIILIRDLDTIIQIMLGSLNQVNFLSWTNFLLPPNKDWSKIAIYLQSPRFLKIIIIFPPQVVTFNFQFLVLPNLVSAVQFSYN